MVYVHICIIKIYFSNYIYMYIYLSIYLSMIYLTICLSEWLKESCCWWICFISSLHQYLNARSPTKYSKGVRGTGTPPIVLVLGVPNVLAIALIRNVLMCFIVSNTLWIYINNLEFFFYYILWLLFYFIEHPANISVAFEWANSSIVN